MRKPMIEINERTKKLLELCKKHNYKRVCIRESSELVPQSVSFPFGPSNSIFCWPCKDKQCIDGWPAIWEIAEILGESSCGNSHQYQISGDYNSGVYVLKNGEWEKIK